MCFQFVSPSFIRRLEFSVVQQTYILTLYLAFNNLRLVRYVPEWFPGAGFQRKAREWRQMLIDTVETPFAYVQNEMVRFHRLSLVL